MAAIVGMRALGLDTFLPLYQPAPGAVLEPAFPGYVFVRFDQADLAWREIHGTAGVIRLLAHDPERPMVVPEHVMAGLVRAYGEGGRELDAASRPEWAPLKVGALVDVMTGPFNGFRAKVLADMGDRVRVAVEVFGRASECELPRAAVGPA